MSRLARLLADPMMSPFVTPEEIPCFPLVVKPAFDLLSPEEKLYAHNISMACWAGFPITVKQTSPEAIHIFNLFQEFFRAFPDFEEMKQTVTDGGNVTEEDFNAFCNYACMFYGNGGNYISFGDTKFIPRLTMETFDTIVREKTPEASRSSVLPCYENCRDAIFSLEPHELELGFNKGPTNLTNSAYYCPSLTESEVVQVDSFLTSRKIHVENTRILKHVTEENVISYEVFIASSELKPSETVEYHVTEDETITITLTYGDYQHEMSQMAHYLHEARSFTTVPEQLSMLESYVDFFTTGDIDSHRTSQIAWVQDQGPVVETNIGFIESYRDPHGARGEFEGWAAVVNKDSSAKYDGIVQQAESIIQSLPWNEDGILGFEKDRFLKPDYTSLEVLSFSASGLPIGINIPNYMDIRQDIGFKNVTLANVLAARQSPDDIPDFLCPDDGDLLTKHGVIALEICVCLHELLGHGSGKSLQEKESGDFNFDLSTLTNPLTNEPIDSWYKPGETWSNLFREYSNPMEECRAESVALYLSSNPIIHDLFQVELTHRDDVSYLIWLEMCWKGIKALPFYSPESEKWLQAHCAARWVILRVMMEAGVAEIIVNEQEEEEELDFIVRVHRERIATDGMAAMKKFLLELMVHKATANVEAGIAFFKQYSDVPEEYLAYRDVVIARKKPRKVFVQGVTHLVVVNGNEEDENNVVVELKEFEASPKGMFERFRFLFEVALAQEQGGEEEE